MRLFDFVYDQLKENPLEDAFAHKVGGTWKKYSTADSVKIITQLSQGLIELGIKEKDKVAIVAEGRPEWTFVDLACQQIGAILVPLYPTLSSKDYQWILKEAEVKMIFVSNSTILKNINTAANALGIKSIYTFNKINGFETWAEVVRKGKGVNKEELKYRMAQVKSEDLCTIIYTSGTSGHPKGVMLSHLNIVSNVLEAKKISTNVGAGDKALSFLPLNHIYERTGIYNYICLGIGVYFAESLETIADNLQEIQPNTFNTVPRLLEKVYDKIIKKGNELSPVKKGIFNWAISLGLKFDPSKSQGALYTRQLKVANKLVFSKWREALGGNIKQIQCGASALQPRLAKVFWAAGIKVLEGYGLTETSPVIAVNQLEKFKFGTVGPVLSNLEVKFGDEDEIMVKGPSVMMGYYNNEKLTKEVLDNEGWFKTGDVGKMVDGCLKITDRKKELFKTSGGLYIAPQQIENKLKESVYIDQVMVIGEGEKFPAALIVPNFEELVELASQRFLLMGTDELLQEESIQKVFKEELERVNADLGRWEQIKEFRLVNQEWKPETDELTPTLKLKRRVILEKYNSLVEDVYGERTKNMFDEIEKAQPKEVDLEELEKMESL